MDQETHRLLGSLEAKVDILLDRSNTEIIEREKDRARITKLEQDVSNSKAIAGFVSAVVAFVATGILGYFTK